MTHTSFTRHITSNLFLLILSLALLPFTTPLTLVHYLRAKRRQPLPILPQNRKTFLISNPYMTKSLHIIRTLSQAGHRVITISTTLLPPAGALSRHSSQHFVVNASSKSTYESELLDIALQTRCDAWIPVSGVQGADLDAAVAETLRSKAGIKVCAPTSEQVRCLDDKASFINLCRKLELDVPETVEIRDVQSAVAVLHSPDIEASMKRYIVKCTSMDDTERGDMTLLPKPSPESTDAFLRKKLAGEKARKTWVLQEYVGPPAKEYATHAVVSCGRIVAFVTVEGGEMVMRYRVVRGSISQALRNWTQKLVEGLNVREGHVSCDFLVRKDPGKPMRVCAIECNPRVHTAMVVMKSDRIVEGYMDMFKEESAAEQVTSFEDGIDDERWWVAHELLTNPLGIMSGKDAEFDAMDPIPWWWAYHVWWPLVFLQSLWRGKRWSRINVSTGKVFQSG
ncbi:hypothetical protein EX30DRAFT_398279 [Ascodesmis nigricans]|uniref:ATP-grasp domain-containing protein n=1 Tax=Ascodesmis nigricans TaxID=341454 RepID=A0A4S2MLT8_9PEZI|nr:hypothetical protein EX30DRAFT_398279 [Ascodesmis nigricans]